MAIQIGAFVSSVTQDRFEKKLVDSALLGNVLTMRLLRDRGREWRGGERIIVPVNLSAYNNVGSYSGFDVLATAQQNTKQRAAFDPSQVYVSIIISGIQRALNQGEAAVIDLVAAEVGQRLADLKDEMGDEVYSDGSGNNSKDILGLLALLDDATDIVTYGGLSRNTFTNWRGTRTAQSGSLSLANLAADVDAAQVGNEIPSLGVCPPAVFTIYEALLTPTVSHQYSSNDFRLGADGLAKVGGVIAANQGFRALTFRGIPIASDEKATANNLFFLNEDHISFYVIPQDVIEGRKAVGSGFYGTEWKEPANQDAVVKEIFWYGQLVTDKPRVHSRRTGVSS